ncbi:MAG: hypothetical protein V4550_12315 [Gemmatimonadota bacterium]
MSSPRTLRWIGAVLAVGVLYLGAGLIFGSLAGSAASNQTRVAWRLAAWALSAVAFAAHIGYEHVRLRSRLSTTAFHAALAAALGGFGLAAAASFHAREVHGSFPIMQLLVWPLLVGMPAFVVALITATVFARVRRGG